MRALTPGVVLGLALTACSDGGGMITEPPVDTSDLAMSIDLASTDMAMATCVDKIKNGSETDVDCGGSSCPRCDIGKGCLASSDCTSGFCTMGMCVGPSCMDGVLNGDETGTDCGGSCMVGCRAGLACKVAADCASDICTGGVCLASGCSDGIKNGSETDVDCGGGACEMCGPNLGCLMDSDCYTKACDPNVHKCVGCGDGARNGDETDVDCGGPLCMQCSLGKTCISDKDCASNLCANGVCAACQVDNDCAFKVCKQGVCSSAPVVGVLNNQTYFKVQVMGAMTDTNVYAACKNAGLKTPCQSMGNCMYNDNLCAPTQEPQCNNPMQGLSSAVCGQNTPPSACSALYGVYQYMGHAWQNDSACGAEMNQWCAPGSQMNNRFALCTL